MINQYRGLLVLYVCAAFLSAGLLFLSEPMVGKLLLPLFGGAPAVWNTCMVFFQAMLLLGYLYTHWSMQKLGFKYQPWVHGVIVLLPLLVLPLAVPAIAAAGRPSLQILILLLVMIGAPFFALTTTGPLLQRWFSGTSHPRAARPYFLYAASNLGSFAALLSYPLLVEPQLSLSQQRLAWSVGYGLFVGVIIVCLIALRRYAVPARATSVVEPAPKQSWRRRLRWVYLAFLPSSLMLGVTTHITTDVASVPLLWIIPLALYLLTFVLVFSGEKAAGYVRRVSPLAAASLFGALVLTILPLPVSPVIATLFYLAVFTLVTLVAHGRLADERPPATGLTEYYLWVAVGGVLGGLFNALIAPVIFNDNYEFPLALLCTVPILLSLGSLRRPGSGNAVFAVVPALLCISFVGLYLAAPRQMLPSLAAILLGGALVAMYYLYRYRPAAYGIGMLAILTVPLLALAAQPNLLTVRTFYGVIKVEDSDGQRSMSHGITKHGSQFTDAARRHEPTTYYGRKGPLGEVFTRCQQSDCRQVGVVGLGAGTVASYGRAGDEITFYEIDRAVAKIAYDSHYFTYISDSPAKVRTVIGDGRLSLAHSSQKYDLLIMDAFSSDAIPQHLLTREALAVYRARLSEHGLLAVHISNRYLNLEPVIAALAKDSGLTAVVRKDWGDAADPLRVASQWVVMSASASDLGSLGGTKDWRPLQTSDVRVWSDDYSNIFDAFRPTQW